jgi:hypothetical protein
MADDYQRLQDAVPGKPTPPVFRVSLDDTRLIPITLSQLWRSMRTALPRDPRHPSDAPGGAWVGKREIARRFGVSARTVDNWLTRGMPHFKPSARMVRFSIADCDEWYRRQFGVHGTGLKTVMGTQQLGTNLELEKRMI